MERVVCIMFQFFNNAELWLLDDSVSLKLQESSHLHHFSQKRILMTELELLGCQKILNSYRIQGLI